MSPGRRCLPGDDEIDEENNSNVIFSENEFDQDDYEEADLEYESDASSSDDEGHSLTVVEADGHYVDPFVVKNLNIYSGETYSVILKADQDPTRNYWLASNVVSRKPGTPTGTGILHYYGVPRGRLPANAPPVGPLWNDTMYRFNQSVAIHAHRMINLLNTQNRVNGVMRWSINNVSFDLPHTPYLIALKNNLNHVFEQRPPPDTYDVKSYDIFIPPVNPNATRSNSIYKLEYGSVVDIILQNANTLTANNSETHPWHLHGHDFWVLGYGLGKFDPASDPKRYNLKNPILKNTVVVHPLGWTAIRFKADNPGVWAFHCHIESHFFMGMGIVFEEGVEKLGQLPNVNRLFEQRLFVRLVRQKRETRIRRRIDYSCYSFSVWVCSNNAYSSTIVHHFSADRTPPNFLSKKFLKRNLSATNSDRVIFLSLFFSDHEI
ncbi:L-ascorbate oxidase [Rhynchospora pubera]|uniref:L-ascorbate oxidase n=1 Tax=Rhynchospora pubera TaxID=906938 RepID=A0AAV8BSI5_9POAL|nr:L-ascorbate oxidase [Rhynchospora pubera]